MPVDHSTNLLTEKDRWCLQRGTVPSKSDPGLVQKYSDGLAVFTVRGLQLYRPVCATLGLGSELAAVRTWAQYIELRIKIIAKRSSRSEVELGVALQRGEVPMQERQAARAALRGDASEVVSANATWRMCVSAGENVLPIGTAKK